MKLPVANCLDDLPAEHQPMDVLDRHDHTLAAGQAVVRLPSAGVALCFQRRYREYWLERDGRGSFSREMRPDVAIEALDERGQTCALSIPAERALTVYVDKQELITLMTLGANPELLVLGYLRNQRLVSAVSEVESITVDWEAGEAGAGDRLRTGAAIAADVGAFWRDSRRGYL